MSDLENTLAERGNRYGDFTDHAAIAQRLQDGMRLTRPNGWERLSDVQRQALTVIADKIARILSGDPNYADNWHDIQGYARLVEVRLPSMVEVRNEPTCWEKPCPVNFGGSPPTHPAWPDDKAYRWMAQDQIGTWNVYAREPKQVGDAWHVAPWARTRTLANNMPNPNWRDTLIERGADE